MFKGAVLRQIRLCRVANTSASIVSRPALLPARQWTALAAAPSLPALSSARRGYHGAAAQETAIESQPVGSQRITKFSELSSVGVHPNLEKAITKGMGYEDMTEVQSMTLNAALSGKDMFVASKRNTHHKVH